MIQINVLDWKSSGDAVSACWVRPEEVRQIRPGAGLPCKSQVLLEDVTGPRWVRCTDSPERLLEALRRGH